ncbi:HEAT repeat domain-containing protein [Aggregatilinea lenta]|uniref:HEAT repeat domain-containing protein n=1 Tax=Aggregatilinea lenta TaxID=913108 RepID=UPI000E5BE6BB|nr:HEAT repeat domain-containing protein [Aggregatilinea lenta]
MAGTERLIAYHMARLTDKNPTVRIQSIEELALLEATDAYGALEDLYRSDPDEAVRKAAQKAGRVLYFKLRESGESAE